MDRTSNSRERLLDAAAELMHARGYDDVSVADLCAAAGARKGSFYHWWPSKRDLAMAMLDRSWEQNRERMFEPIFGSDEPVTARFRRYGDFLADNLATVRDRCGRVVGCRFGNLAVELATRDEAVRMRIEETFRRIADVFAAAIRDGIARGEVPPGTDADDAAEAILAHMEGLMVVAKAKDDPAVLRRLGGDAARLLGVTAP